MSGSTGEKSLVFSGQMLSLIFNGTTIPNIAQNATSSPLTNFFAALHTGDPTASGNQATNEVNYTGYARLVIPRNTSGWTQSGNQVNPTANLIWPTCTGAAGQIITFLSIGIASSGATTFLYAVPVSPPVTVTVGLPPTFTTASLITEA